MIEFIVRLFPVILLGLQIVLFALLFEARSVKVLRIIEWSLCANSVLILTVFRSFRLDLPRSFHDALQRGSDSLIPIWSKDLAASPHYHWYSDPERVRLSCSSCAITRSNQSTKPTALLTGAAVGLPP
jgi:hypothetical protein